MRVRPYLSPTIAVAAALAVTATIGVGVGVAIDRHAPLVAARAEASTPKPSAEPRQSSANGALVPARGDRTAAEPLPAGGIRLVPGHYRSVLRHRDLGGD